MEIPAVETQSLTPEQALALNTLCSVVAASQALLQFVDFPGVPIESRGELVGFVRDLHAQAADVFTSDGKKHIQVDITDTFVFDIVMVHLVPPNGLTAFESFRRRSKRVAADTRIETIIPHVSLELSIDPQGYEHVAITSNPSPPFDYQI